MSTLSTYFLNEINNIYKPVLNEEIYTRKETKLIDAEFKIILDWFKKPDNMMKVRKEKFDTDKYFKKQLLNIEKLIKQLLNGNIMLRFDRASKFDKLSFGMCTYPSNEELHGKIKDALENNKGFYLYECNNSLCLIDYAMINIIIKNNLNERALTAILLHELGHHVYVKSQDDIRSGNVGNEDITKKNKNSIMVYIGGAVFFIPILSNSFKSKNVIISLLSTITMIISSGILYYNYNRYYEKLDIERYVKSEALSDLLAVKYGYGYEIAKTMDIFYAMFKVKNNSKLKILKFFSKRANELDASKLRRSEVKKALEEELRDSKNNPRIQKNIKDAITAIEEMESLNEAYNFDFAFCSACESLYESLTFRTVEMKRIKEMLYSKKNIDKLYKLNKKGWTLVKTESQLNPLQLKVVENKIREIAEETVTNTVDGGVNSKHAKVGAKRSRTHLDLKNIVLMEVKGFLCIVQANDKGRIISTTTIYINDSEMIKFVKLQSAVFKI